MSTPFSSFPGFGDSSSSNVPPVNPKPSRQSKKGESESRSSRHKKDHKEHPYTRSRERRPSRSPTPRHHLEDERKHEKLHSKRHDHDERGFDTTPNFFIDRRGDPLNLQYGRPHSGDVPKYRHIAGGRNVLGLPSAYAVISRTMGGVEIGLASRRRRMPELTDSSTRKQLAAGPSKRIITSEQSRYKYDEVAGFLRLPSGRKQMEQNYRDIEKQDDNSDSSAEENDFEEESDGEDAITLSAGQEQLRDLERRVKSEPKSVSAWFALLQQTLSVSPEVGKNTTQARADITLAVLGRAMMAHLDNKRALSLRLRYLRAGEMIWPQNRLLSEWDTALQAIDSPELVLEWLDWRIRVEKLGADGIVRDGVKALGLMHNDEVANLRVFWRVAIALQQAGFVERAAAMFQAQAEVTFTLPLAFAGLPFDAIMSEFELFWDAEVPRLGEAGANGWASWDSSVGDSPSPSAPLTPPDISGQHDPYVQWGGTETWHDRTAHLSIRGLDDADDPYSTVLFADVRPLLFSLTITSSRIIFRKLWLTFCGLHIPGFLSSLPITDDNVGDQWSGQHITSPPRLRFLFPTSDSMTNHITADSYAGVLIGREPSFSCSALDLPVREWGANVRDPFENASDTPPRLCIWTSVDAASTNPAIVRNVFSACRLDASDEEWDALSLAYEAAIDAKRAVKLSKAQLAASQVSVSRWAIHARLERSRGKLEEARKIYRTVLSGDTDVAKDPCSARLWWDWAEMEWMAGQEGSALSVILRSVDVTDAAGMGILRARRLLDDHTVKPKHPWQVRVAWVQLRALLELLTTRSPEAMLVVLDANSSRLPGTAEDEALTLTSCLLLFHHSRTLSRTARPVILRDRAATALARFPSNTLLFGLVLESERGQAIWGRTRALVGANGEDKTVLRRVAEVWAAGWDHRRWAAEAERVRSSLGAAVSSDRLRGSFVMWRVYLEFEIRNGELGKAKKLLFRAVAECPMCKELYLLAFGPLRSVFKSRELNDFAETMAERGIRMRTGLDEFLAQSKNMSVDEDNSDEGQELGYREEDIERNAEDVRRLRPY